MLSKIKYCATLLLLFPLFTKAQNEADNWYFGNKSALNFSSCNPTIVNGSQINTIEGCATISDINGNLLFYTDGIKVWSKNNVIMQNGTGLYGDPSSTQSGIIVPQPGNDSIFYIFTADVEGGSRGLNYSVVNINLNGGLGAVISKNTNIIGSTNEKVTAVHHSNQQDIWVITRLFQSDKYYAWLVTVTGISATPVISTSPNLLGPSPNISRGYLKASTDGKKLVAAFDEFPFLEFSSFNNQTGAITNTIKINSQPNTVKSLGVVGSYGIEFSPDNKLLYIGTILKYNIPCPTCPIRNTYINQLNVTNVDSASIANSAVLIDSGGSVFNPAYDFYGSLQLAKNGKIYIAQYDKSSLSVINNPNSVGLACNFQKDATSLGAGKSTSGLPTFIQSYFNPNYRSYDYNYTEDCNKTLSFSLSTIFTYDSLRWDFDDPASGNNNISLQPNPTHTYNSNSIHSVKLFVFNHYGCINKTDTVTKQITVGNKYFNLGVDTTICIGDTIWLNATVAGANSYLWNTGATTSTIKISSPDIYWCDVNFGGCVYRDSLILGNKPYPVVNLGIDTTICENNTLKLNAINPNSTYLWNDGSTFPTFIVTQKGSYNVKVNMAGCIMKDTINIDYQLKPRFTLGEDRVLCLGNSYTLKPTITNGTSSQGLSYLWQDGSVMPTYTVTQQGVYRLELSNLCGSTSDDININKGVCELYVPNAFSPNGDTKNDIFKASFGDNVVEFQMQVYNRYGQIVFTTSDKSKGWDGNLNGKPQQEGTYTWGIRYKTITGNLWQELQGAVILLR